MNDDRMNENPDNAGVRIPPPIIVVICLLAGLLYDSAWISGRLAPVSLSSIGAIVALMGIALIVYSAPRHKKAGSNVEPWKPTTAIISTGVYAYSRNPIY